LREGWGAIYHTFVKHSLGKPLRLSDGCMGTLEVREAGEWIFVLHF